MQIATSFSTRPNSTEAISTAYSELIAQMGVTPDLLFVHCSATYDCESLVQHLSTLAPNIPLHGATSCMGAMTRGGFHSEEGTGLALLGLSDPMGAYGVGACELGSDPRAAASQALTRALAHAGRPGESPAMVLIASAPGFEELIIAGIEDTVGNQVPIAGGSSADNNVSGQWRQFANGDVYRNAVVLTVLFPTTEVLFAFHSGYEPTPQKGRATKAQGRTLLEIDGRPAARVYNEWLGDTLEMVLEQGSKTLAFTSLNPLGRQVSDVGGIPYYQLSLPVSVSADSSLTLLSEVNIGDELTLMEGSVNSIVSRAGRVATSMLETQSISPSEIAGALVIFCCGSMLTVQHQMPAVANGISRALEQSPFLCAFTLGEQGCFLGGENRHGNMMISVLLFKK